MANRTLSLSQGLAAHRYPQEKGTQKQHYKEDLRHLLLSTTLPAGLTHCRSQTLSQNNGIVEPRKS